jgi:hypothetical protein
VDGVNCLVQALRLKLRYLVAIVFLLFAPFSHANELRNIETAAFSQFSLFTPAPTNSTFTALHTYYIAPTTASPAGNDSNSGTSASPWATPHHTGLVCGDVILAATGNYGTFDGLSYWGTPTGCPSTSGGIDGTGGIYFVTILCTGTLGSCTTNQMTGVAFNITANNWAVEGWSVNSSDSDRAYQGYGCNTASAGPNTMLHHIAFINDISADNYQAFDTDDCGDNYGSVTVPSPAGVDYSAVVGMIAQNSAQENSSVCIAAIDMVGPGVLDNNAGTHLFVYGNFSYANANPNCTGRYDTEDYMADSWEAHDFVATGVYANNIGYLADRYGFQWTGTGVSSQSPTVKVYNNTLFEDDVNTGADNLDGDINIGGTVTIYAAITIQNNLVRQPLPYSAAYTSFTGYVTPNSGYSTLTVTSVQSGSISGGYVLNGGTNLGKLSNGGTGTGGTGTYFLSIQETVAPVSGLTAHSAVAAFVLDTTANAITNGGSGQQNFFLANNTVCNATFCNSTYDAQTYGASTTLGTNTYTDPAFVNTTDLLANQVGVPNCSGFVTTTACMGWNANTSTLTTPSVISDLVPTASGTTGKGYQLPSTTCTANADYPTWLKGIVYLHWNGSSITENKDLVTEPCGM